MDYHKLLHDLHILIGERSPDLTEDEQTYILHFVDVDEYGLAMEDLLDILGKNEEPLEHAKYDRLAEVARAMGMEEQTLPLKPSD
jgi:hypothetical protein